MLLTWWKRRRARKENEFLDQLEERVIIRMCGEFDTIAVAHAVNTAFEELRLQLKYYAR